MVSLSLFTCICLQSIDAFFGTSRSVVLRQKSSIKIARFLLFLVGLIWAVHEISTLVFQDYITNGSTSSCIITNAIYAFYRCYFVVPVLTIVIPISMMSAFGFYIYRNLHIQALHENHMLSNFTKQLTKMVLLQIASVLIFQVPYGFFTVYSLATTSVVKDAYRQGQERLTSTFFSIYVYGLYTVKDYLTNIIFSILNARKIRIWNIIFQ